MSRCRDFSVAVLLKCILLGLCCEVIGEAASKCDSSCRLPSCRCSGTDIPGNLRTWETPQFVLVTFYGAVNSGNVYYYKKAFQNRQNTQKCSPKATFFVNHEYTDYSVLNSLYNEGHEIALHSISNKPLTKYWKEPSSDDLHAEFAGERELISKFAGIPQDALKGIRLPLLQMGGDKTFEMLKTEGLLYDNTWVTNQNEPGIWPYTLDYQSTQECIIGPCPTGSFPGVWEVPLLMWRDANFLPCSTLDACFYMPNTTEEIFNLMVKNFNRSYKTNKAPFGLHVQYGWFATSEARFEAYLKFIDYLDSLPDVFLVGVSDVIEWIKNPVRLPQKLTCPTRNAETCNKNICQLKRNNMSYRLVVCGSCPKTYPWVENPTGQ